MTNKRNLTTLYKRIKSMSSFTANKESKRERANKREWVRERERERVRERGNF